MFENGRPNKGRLVALLNGQRIGFNESELAKIFGFPTNNVM